MTSQTRNQITS